MDEKPFAHETLEYRQNPRENLLTRNHFIHKFYGALKGFDYFDSLVQVDWDVVQLKPLTDNWWEKQDSYGVPFRAAIRKGIRQCFCAKWRKDQEDRRKITQCGCIWFGDRTFVNSCIDINHENPVWMPEIVVSRKLDNIYGTWIGTDEYIRLGYEADFVRWASFRYRNLSNPSKKTAFWLKRH